VVGARHASGVIRHVLSPLVAVVVAGLPGARDSHAPSMAARAGLTAGTTLPRAPRVGHHQEADDGPRTRDPQLGKLVLYQLSYVRK
jgi:hypothetical protein